MKSSVPGGPHDIIYGATAVEVGGPDEIVLCPEVGPLQVHLEVTTSRHPSATK